MSDNPEEYPTKRRRILPSSHKPNEDEENEIDGIFQGMRIYIHDRINPTRRRVLRSLITQHGGTNSFNADENVTHIITDETTAPSDLCSHLGYGTYIPSNIHVLVAGWVSSCIRANRILNSRHFIFSCPRGPMVQVTVNSSDHVEEEFNADIEVSKPRERKFADPSFPREAYDANADIEDNKPRERKFADPSFPREAYENTDIEERKFWSPLEDVSTFDDFNYNSETTCDDEWLLIPLPKLPACDPSSNTAENADEEVENCDVEKEEDDDDVLEDNILEQNEAIESKSKEDEPEAKSGNGAHSKKKSKKKKGKKKSEKAKKNKKNPPENSPEPFENRPDNTAGRLSCIRLKCDKKKEGEKTKWSVVQNKNEASQKSKGDLPYAGSSTGSNMHCPPENPNFNLEDDMQVSPIHQSKVVNDVNRDKIHEPGRKRKQDPASPEEHNEGNKKDKISRHKRKQSQHDFKSTLPDAQQAADQGGPEISKKKKKPKSPKKKDEKISASISCDENTKIATDAQQVADQGGPGLYKKKTTSPKRKDENISDENPEKNTLTDAQQAADQGGPEFPEKEKEASLPKLKDENTLASISSDKNPGKKALEDESYGKISIKKPSSEETVAGKFPCRKPKRSISAPASPTPERITGEKLIPTNKIKNSSAPASPTPERITGEKLIPTNKIKNSSAPASPTPERITGEKLIPTNKIKNSSAPASPITQEEWIENLSSEIHRKIEQSKNTSEQNNLKKENIPNENPNSSNSILDQTIQEINLQLEYFKGATDRKNEIRKHVMNYFSRISLNNDDEEKEQKKKSADKELHFTENSKENDSSHFSMPSCSWHLDAPTNGPEAKISVGHNNSIKRSDLDESQINVDPDQSQKSPELDKNSKTPTLAEANISEESTSSKTRSVIQFAKSALNCNSSASSVSHLSDLPMEGNAIDESKPKECSEDIGASDKENLHEVLDEENTSNNLAVEEVSKPENINSTDEKLQNKSSSIPASPNPDKAPISNIDQVDSEGEESQTNEIKPPVFIIGLECAVGLDVQLRLNELYFTPKTENVLAEIEFLLAELEQRKFGDGKWQTKLKADVLNDKSLTDEERIRILEIKARIGYWIPLDNLHNPQAVRPVQFRIDAPAYERPINYNAEQPAILPRISHDIPQRGEPLLFPLPEPAELPVPDIIMADVLLPIPERITSEVSFRGETTTTKHYLSPMCPNFKIIQELQRLYQFFKKTKDLWRMHAYEQSIFALGKYPKLIQSFEEAQSVLGLGRRIASKVWEIRRRGKLQEINDFCNSDWVATRRMLTRAWGITPRVARKLYKENLYSLDKVWCQENLGHSYRVAIRYYKDLSKKMSRAEADEIAAIVVSFFKMQNANVEVEACSSIRRGKKLCSYVSMLIVLPKGIKNGHRLLDDTVMAMHKEAFLIDDMIRHDDEGDQCKYSGIFQINDHAKYRRLDLTVVPYIEQVCARFFLTGPSYFLRAMTKYAERSEMVLDKHCVRMRLLDGEGQTHTVMPMHLSTEVDLFNLIGVPYREPEERDIIPFSTVKNDELV